MELQVTGGKTGALGENTVQCPILHCTSQANCPVFKHGTPWQGCILQKYDKPRRISTSA